MPSSTSASAHGSPVLAEHEATEPTELIQEGLGPFHESTDGAQLYLDLLKRTIVNIVYQDAPLFYCDLAGPRPSEGFNLARRVLGEDMPSQAHSMVGIRRLENIQACVEQVLAEDVPGDLIEMGVARGGSAIFMRGVLKAYGCTDRKVYAADAFVPPTSEISPFRIFLAKWFVRGLAAIPIRCWQRSLAERVFAPAAAFLRSKTPTTTWWLPRCGSSRISTSPMN